MKSGSCFIDYNKTIIPFMKVLNQQEINKDIQTHFVHYKMNSQEFFSTRHFKALYNTMPFQASWILFLLKYSTISGLTLITLHY